MLDRERIRLKLKGLRRDANMTYMDLEAATGIVKSSLCNYETGESLPDLERMYILASFYGITMDEILCRTTASTLYADGIKRGREYELRELEAYWYKRGETL